MLHNWRSLQIASGKMSINGTSEKQWPAHTCFFDFLLYI